ncbi:hypothetical protein CRUP_024666, partial [Coryphaenoides rupestris]
MVHMVHMVTTVHMVHMVTMVHMSSVAGAASSLAAAQRPPPGAGEQSGRQRPTVYVAMFPYTPRKEDELELRKGEMFLVLERQPKLPLTLSSQPGRSLTILAASSSSSSSSSSVPASPGPDASKPLPPCPGPVGMPQAAVVATAAQTATGQQPKVIVHVNSQMTVNQARNAVRTAANHGQDRPTASVPPLQSAPPGAFLAYPA